jgi:hypothetical protein
MSFCDCEFNFAKYLWNSDKMEEGYFTIGVPFISSNSEVLYAAYQMSILINNSSFLYNALQGEEVIESALRNFYELGGKIIFDTNAVTFNPKLSLMLDDENIEKILYCIFLIHKFNRPDIFYIKHIENAMQFFPTEEVDLIIAKVLYNAFDNLRIKPYIVKEVPIAKTLVANIKNYREVVIWELYQNLRGILVTDKISLSGGKIIFEEEYFDSYIASGTNADFFIKPEVKQKATGYTLIMVLRKMGNSAFIYRPKINTDGKFLTLIFLVVSRLITLNRMNFLHGDLHAANFVLEISRDRWYSDYISCEELIIRNNIDLYNSFDLIDFGKSVEFRESDALIEFFKEILPNLYENRKTLIERLARTSPTDFAIAISPLDLYKFVESFYSASKDYEQIRKTRDDIQAYILEQLNSYLDANDTTLGGIDCIFNNNFEYNLGGDDSDIGNIAGIKSIVPDTIDTDFFVGGDINPNYSAITQHHNITHNILPLYKLMQHFYSHESSLIDRQRVTVTIQ